MTDLSNIKPGDKLAIISHSNRYMDRGAPHVTHVIFTVERKTQTQIVLSRGPNSSEAARVRIKDACVIGKPYTKAVEATPEILAEHKAQVEALRHYRMTTSVLSDLMGKQLHQLNLSIQQIEHLAKAWEEVKAMGQKQEG